MSEHTIREVLQNGLADGNREVMHDCIAAALNLLDEAARLGHLSQRIWPEDDRIALPDPPAKNGTDLDFSRKGWGFTDDADPDPLPRVSSVPDAPHDAKETTT